MPDEKATTPRKRRHLPISTACIILLLLPVNIYAVAITIDQTTPHQTIEGFGGGFMFGVWPYGHTFKTELYDSIFNKAGCNIVRIGNFYDPEKADTGEVTEIPLMKEVQALYPQVKALLTAWSPPNYLKAGDTIAGIVAGEKKSLKKTNGQFVYEQYADYWYKSIDHFQKGGVTLNWISIQNEPDWPAEWDGCYFTPFESEAFASYDKALDAVFTKSSSLGVPFVGPDITGPAGVDYSLTEYMESCHQNQLSAISHHYYNGSDISMMRSVRKFFPSLPRFQTEHLINEGLEFKGKILTWFDHVNLIQNALLEEDVSMYLLFALAYKATSTHCFFSLDSTGSTYTTRPIYYAFKHFSKSIHRGWRRIDAHGGGSLKVSAFSNPGRDSMAIVVVNNGEFTTANLPGLSAEIESGEIRQTTQGNGSDQSRKYELLADFTGALPEINLDKHSITTIDLRVHPLKINRRLNKPGLCMSLPTIAAHDKQKITLIMNNAVDRPYTISLVTVSGKILRQTSADVQNSRTVVKTLTGPFSSGVYILRVRNAHKTFTIPITIDCSTSVR